jgi:Tol biopolymer transport system component
LLFSPDGKRLAISVDVTGPGEYRSGGVKVIDLSDRTLTGFTMRDGIILDKWTPDGKNILFWEDPDFSASFAADGLPLFAVSFPEGKVRSLGVETLAYPTVNQFSPDGRFLAVTEGTGRATWTNKRISVVDLLSGAKAALTPENFAALFPSWSPSGESIAYAAGPEVSDEVREGPDLTLGEVHIWVMKADGSQALQLTSDPAYRDQRPRWSADGKSIVFCRVSAAEEGSVWRVGATGGKPEQLAGPLALEDGMFGFYGYTDWGRTVDVRRY